MKHHLFRYFSFSVISIIVVLLISGCENDPAVIRSMTYLSTAPSMSAKNIEVIFSDSGKIQARLYSILMNRFNDQKPYLEFPKGFKIIMYDSAMRVSSTITGNYGKKDEITRIMEAKGNVIVRNELESKQLNTEHLVWDEMKQLIYSDVRVKITTPNKVLYGSAMKANEAFTWYQIPNVSATLTVNRDSI